MLFVDHIRTPLTVMHNFHIRCLKPLHKKSIRPKCKVSDYIDLLSKLHTSRACTVYRFPCVPLPYQLEVSRSRSRSKIKVKRLDKAQTRNVPYTGRTEFWSKMEGRISCPSSFIQSFLHFYRATRMHSADYAVARCLSVCLSNTGIESK